MRKLSIFCAAVLVLASCSSMFDSGKEGSKDPQSETQTPDDSSGDSSEDSSADDPGTTEEGPVNPYSDDLQGWHSKSYFMDKIVFDTTLEFHYNERGYIDYYLEHTLSYKDDGVTVWSDDKYKRIYYYTTPTHIDYYNDYIEGNSPATWYDFDNEGRIKEEYNHYGDNYLYHYNDKGQLVEIENSYQYQEEEDEEKYGSWKKSYIIEWSDLDYPMYFGQKWTSGSETVFREETMIQSNTAYTNPFRGMAIDPTVLGSGLFSMMGWWGTRSEYLITGWYDAEDPGYRTVITLLTDREDHIIGMKTESYNGGLDTRREYTFSWKGEAPILKQDGIPIIN